MSEMSDVSSASPGVRLATATDVAAIERLVQDAYGHYVERLGYAPGPMLDDYAERVRQAQAWVIEEDGAITALLVLIGAPGHILVDNVAVRPENQGRGFGRRLLDFAEAEARRRGETELRLYTHVLMHENIALYRRCGWTEYARGEQAGFPRVFMLKPVASAGPGAAARAY